MQLTTDNIIMLVMAGIALAHLLIGVFNARNCDRFDNFDDAHKAFLKERPGGTMYELDDWLFERPDGFIKKLMDWIRRNKEAK